AVLTEVGRSPITRRTATTRAVIERAWLSWPRLVWSSARLTARIFMQRRRVGERPLLPRTGRAAALMLSWPASAAGLLTCDFLVSWRSIVRRSEVTRDP